MAAAELWQWQHADAVAGQRLELETSKVEFADITGWDKDDHHQAFLAFRKSCTKLLARSRPEGEEAGSLAAICRIAVMLPPKLSPQDARNFFEGNFQPHLVKRPEKGALLTGYFEPEVKGALQPSKQFSTPIYAKPDDLVLLSRVADRSGLPEDLTAVRVTPEGPAPYYTRREIEEGALKGRGLEIAYLADPYEAFVMQIQGSGLIRLPDGRGLRIGFAGKNGHPYTSVGKILVERGELESQSASLEKVLDWLRAEKQRGRELMWENKSYAFFRVLSTEQAAQGPQGAMMLPLSPGRSLAVDPRYHELGAPIWVSAPTLADAHGKPVHRLMVAQDTGSAIKGPVRGDIFWGSGHEAGKIAGRTKHICDFYVLMPK
jgi:membrane-bound lytic murein transglycosylase A